MNPQICLDIFTICILVHVDCDLEINETDKKKEFEAVRGRSYPFTVGFIYMLGTDYDVSHANFGFSAEYPSGSDQLDVQMNGVSVSGHQFTPALPDTTQSASAMLSAIYSAALAFTNDQTIYDRLLALSMTGNARFNPLFGGEIAYNQGV